ncbi:MAG: 50S ribosomal protein L4 [Simkaniaceae bacterium]|nr:50S ribosomal protein L4 [Simkaniaceae bacterium]
MATLKKYDITGKEVGQLELADDLLDIAINSQMLKDYLVAIRNNKRQWSACTKGRSEVNHSNAKPHPQKGTGRARQGTLAAPQYKGGGVVFGPKPKFDQHVRINKKEKRAAIRFLIAEKIKAGRLRVLEGAQIESPKTKVVAGFIKNIGIQDRKVLFLGESFADEQDAEKLFEGVARQDLFIKSMRNIPKTRFLQAQSISGLDVADGSELVVLDGALQDLMLMLGA